MQSKTINGQPGQRIVIFVPGGSVTVDIGPGLYNNPGENQTRIHTQVSDKEYEREIYGENLWICPKTNHPKGRFNRA